MSHVGMHELAKGINDEISKLPPEKQKEVRWKLNVILATNVGFLAGLGLSGLIDSLEEKPDIGVSINTADLSHYRAIKTREGLEGLSKASVAEACSRAVDNWFAGKPPVVSLTIPAPDRKDKEQSLPSRTAQPQ